MNVRVYLSLLPEICMQHECHSCDKVWELVLENWKLKLETLEKRKYTTMKQETFKKQAAAGKLFFFGRLSHTVALL